MAGTPAFQLYAGDHPAIPRTLRARLEKLAADKTGQLGSAQDWPDFCARRGVIQGLALAIEECREAEKQQGD